MNLNLGDLLGGVGGENGLKLDSLLGLLTKKEYPEKEQEPVVTPENNDGGAVPITLDFTKDKIGLALGGGGLLGAFQLGALQYLIDAYDLGMEDFYAVLGTSIGAIITGSVLSLGFEGAKDIIMNITPEDVMTDDFDAYTGGIMNKLLSKLLGEGGNSATIGLLVSGLFKGTLDTTPLRNLIKDNVDDERVRNSKVQVGFTVNPSSSILSPLVKKGDDLIDHVADWMIASSSCWPVFKAYKVDGKLWIDGGYADSTNAKMMYDEFGCEKIVALDIQNRGGRMTDTNIVHILSSADLGSFLDFDPEVMNRNYQQGYNDTKEYFEKYVTVIK